MRQLILDTETTGLDYHKDRSIEVHVLNWLTTNIQRKDHNYYNNGVLISNQSEQLYLSNAFLRKFDSLTIQLIVL